MSEQRIAIVGAGVSGLAAAWALREAPWEVTVLEKSRGLSGRAASRSREGVRFDYGANYFKTDSPEMERLVLEELSTEGLVDIARDVWTFDGKGFIAPGNAAQNAAPKWTYTSGISTLGKRLAEASGAALRRETRVGRLARGEPGWEVFDSGGEALGVFEAVLLTLPAPQAADLLEASEFEEGLQGRLTGELRRVRYHRQVCCVLGFEEVVKRPGNFYALVNADRRHAVAWVGFEEDKPGRVPEGESVVVVQMAPGWSAERNRGDDEAIAGEVRAALIGLLGGTLPAVRWHYVQRWRYAHPETGCDGEVLREGEGAGLFFAGDALAGEGRVARAVETGLAAGARVRNSS